MDTDNNMKVVAKQLDQALDFLGDTSRNPALYIGIWFTGAGILK